VTDLGDSPLVFPAIAFSCLIGIAYALGRESARAEERRRNDARRAHRSRQHWWGEQ